MAQTPSFDLLVNQLRKKDGDAARKIYERFAGRLIRLAQKNMSRKLQRKVDPEDVAQSVLKSGILRLRDGHFDVGDWDGLWGLMVCALR
jgi:RNA polymerase sigma-70 factor (ECF subfamily)